MESVWRNCVLFVKAAPPPPRSGANRPGLEKAFKARPVRISGTVHVSPSLLLRLFQRRRRPFLSAFFPSRQRWQKFQESGSCLLPGQMQPIFPVPFLQEKQIAFHQFLHRQLPDKGPSLITEGTVLLASTSIALGSFVAIISQNHAAALAKLCRLPQQVVHRHLEYLSHQFQRVRVGNRLTRFP